jgi:hypothetical protein
MFFAHILGQKREGFCLHYGTEEVHHILYARFGIRTPDIPLIHLNNGILVQGVPNQIIKVYKTSK